jgi:hypothetical protein
LSLETTIWYKTIEVRAWINPICTLRLTSLSGKESSSLGALMRLFVSITIMIRPVRGKLDERKIARKTRDSLIQRRVIEGEDQIEKSMRI